MPFIPHTQNDVTEMLTTIGVSNIEQLFDEIPASLRNDKLNQVPTALNEMAVSRLMRNRAAQDDGSLCFLGAGAYEHHIPAAVWELTTRGEFYSAYTPYQAEASQGTLQVLYEFQTMMARLTSMDVSNTSLYDGASSLAEAVLMAVRLRPRLKSKTILMPRTVHPIYRKVVATIVKHQHIQLREVDYHHKGGHIDIESLSDSVDDVTAIVIPQPNFFGVVEDVDDLTDWAHKKGALVIAVVNPLALALLKPPGEWGSEGADLVCGEGQPLGVPLSSGGPYLGFLCCKNAYVRQMPGRIVGRTLDSDGNAGFTLTLQTREQHIRRSKATSNICTNQGLLVTAATIHIALLGAEGLERVAKHCHVNTLVLVEKMASITGVEKQFDRACFHETVLRIEAPVHSILNKLAEQKILGGYALEADYPELKNTLLVCATETRTTSDLDQYTEKMQEIIAEF